MNIAFATSTSLKLLLNSSASYGSAYQIALGLTLQQHPIHSQHRFGFNATASEPLEIPRRLPGLTSAQSRASTHGDQLVGNSKNLRAQRVWRISRYPMRRQSSVPRSNCRSNNPRPTPTHSRACRVSRTHSAQTHPPVPSGRYPNGCRTHRNSPGCGLSDSPRNISLSSLPAPHTPIWTRSANDIVLQFP